jgi:hypothetical protein
VIPFYNAAMFALAAMMALTAIRFMLSDEDGADRWAFVAVLVVTGSTFLGLAL